MSVINDQLGLPSDGRPTYQPHLYNGGLNDERAKGYDFPIAIGTPYRNAEGDYSNLWGTTRCKTTCRTLFPSDRKLRSACKNSCESRCNRKSKCPDSYVPTRASVCTQAGLNADCTPKVFGGSSTSDTTVDGKMVDENGNVIDAPNQGMSTGAKVAIGVGVIAVLGLVTYFVIKKRK
jgi:hypothetical protein